MKYLILSPEVNLIQILVVNNGMTVSSRDISHWNIELIRNWERNVFSPFSSESPVVVAAPGVHLALVRKRHRVHASANNFEDSVCKSASHVEKWDSSGFLNFRRLVVSKT